MTTPHRTLFSDLPIKLLVGLTLIGVLYTAITTDVHALAQRVGDFELALDAPWRMEPRASKPVFCDPSLGDCSVAPSYEYGEIPIQVSIHDADFPNSVETNLLQQLIEVRQSGESVKSIVWAFVKDVFSFLGLKNIDTVLEILGIDIIDSDLPSLHPVTQLQQFVSITVAEEYNGVYQVQRRFRINDTHEVERTLGHWLWSASQSSSESPQLPPPRPFYQLCRRWDGDDCAALAGLRQTSEWHGIFFYRPTFGTWAGRDVRLRLDLKVLARVDGVMQNKTFTHYVNVHLGDAPLPKFDNRWVYGDLHYHSQGTDNDGESAYSYRGVLQTMGAMGLDFVFATDHASNSRQIAAAQPVFSPEIIEPVFRGLRDMSPDRFAFNLGLLNGPGGANEQAVSYPRRMDQFGTLAAPQLFLGAEVDVIPEFAPGHHYPYPYANACRDLPGIIKVIDQGIGLGDLLDSLLGWDFQVPESVCTGDQLLAPTSDGRYLIRDVQGPADGRLISTGFFGRQHVLHLPTDPLREDAFIPSNTSKYGGATRRLAEILDRELGKRDKGFMFLAHPLSRAGGSDFGRLGPDIAPYSEAQYRDAFASPHFLGLQTWNENGQLRTSIDKGDAQDYNGHFVPVHDLDNWKHASQKVNPYKFANSAKQWDTLLLWGLDPNETAQLDWLPTGEPRRVFMAGGSDAHGDFNFRREGYFLGTDSTNDTAIGTPRNLVFIGDPDGELLRSPHGTGHPHSQPQIVQALRDGNFIVTDGPAIRIAYDNNRNGVIDDDDTLMGGVIDKSNQCAFPIIVEWKSTPEFGRLERIDIYVGVHADAHQRGVVYQAWRAPRIRVDGELVDATPADIGGSSVWHDQKKAKDYVRAPGSFYWYDPTEETLAIDVASYEGYTGRRRIFLDPADYPVGNLRSQCRNSAAVQATNSSSGTSPARITGGRVTSLVRAVPNATTRNLTVQSLSSATTGAVSYRRSVANKPVGSNVGGLLDDWFDPQPPLDPPPLCEMDNFFDNAATPDRLFVRAVATNSLAPGTDHACNPSAYTPQGDERPRCVRRRAYSNPLWVNLNEDRYGRLCSPTTGTHVAGVIAVDNNTTSGNTSNMTNMTSFKIKMPALQLPIF